MTIPRRTRRALTAALAGLGAGLAPAASQAQAGAGAQPLLRPCDETNVSLLDLAIDETSGVRTFYEGDVLVLAIDQVEPAAASAGLVILALLPDGGPGERRCMAATGFASLDLDRATSAYDPGKGLSLTIPAGNYDDERGAVPGRPLVITINLGTGAMSAAR